MSKFNYSDSIFTKRVKDLLSKTYGRSSLKDSLVDRATTYFAQKPFQEHKSEELRKNIAQLEAMAPDKKRENKLKILLKQQKEFVEELSFDRNDRHRSLHVLCQDIITLCDIDNFDENNRKSAQVLATIQLVSPTEGSTVAKVNDSNKPLYKSILCLRLLDRLCLDNKIVEPYITGYLKGITPQTYLQFKDINPEGYQAFVDNVKIPVLIASLLQDIGQNHPDAQQIIRGAKGDEDPYRMLSLDERKQLLQINYRESIKFLTEGIGVPSFVGNSKVEREKFAQNENKKILFIKFLLKAAVKPKESIGNLLKVPQIYSSIVLSTKASYNYKLLPKVYSALYQNAERGACSKVVVDALLSITGHFPMGYGITYIPEELEIQDRYEYGIVTKLYPKDPEEPNCRMATKNLAFISHGSDVLIKKSHNLHFNFAAKAFARISKERLNEILQVLASNYEERKSLDLLPRCWHPNSFFSQSRHQKLWNKVQH